MKGAERGFVRNQQQHVVPKIIGFKWIQAVITKFHKDSNTVRLS